MLSKEKEGRKLPKTKTNQKTFFYDNNLLILLTYNCNFSESDKYHLYDVVRSSIANLKRVRVILEFEIVGHFLQIV